LPARNKKLAFYVLRKTSPSGKSKNHISLNLISHLTINLINDLQ